MATNALRFIPFGRFASQYDVPAYHNPAFDAAGYSQIASNVVPRDIIASQPFPQLVYAPFNSPQAFSTPLGARCQGAFAFFSQVGDISIYAGTVHKIYQMTVAGTTFTDISASGGYATDPEDFWFFTSFADTILATNYHDPVQQFTTGLDSAFSNLATAAPKAKFIATVRNFVMVGNTVDPIDGAQPQRIWWSGENDPSNWPVPGSNAAVQVQSDFNDVFGTHGHLTGLIPQVGKQDAVAFFERGIFNLVYVGGQVIFAFSPVIGAKGTSAPMSIVKEGTRCYYFSEDGFHVYDGSDSIPIGFNRVDNFVKTECDPNFVGRIVGASDPDSKCIVWCFPGFGSANGVPNKAIAYNWAIGEWAGPIDIQQEFIFRGSTFGVNLEQLGVLYPNIEDVPFSFDSPVWSNNKIVLSGFDDTHHLNYFSGNPLIPTIETPTFMLGDGANIPTDTRGVILNAKPVFDGIYATPITAITARETLNQAAGLSSFVAPNYVGLCNHRISGRHFTARLSMATNALWDKLLGVEIDARAAGRR